MTVAQIFEEEGEEAFRDVEAAVLNEVASYARMVVSTGGGIVTRRTNWGHLRNGVVLYLDAPVECVAATSVLYIDALGLLCLMAEKHMLRRSAGCWLRAWLRTAWRCARCSRARRRAARLRMRRCGAFSIAKAAGAAHVLRFL